jgi:hypothetical protein
MVDARGWGLGCEGDLDWGKCWSKNARFQLGRMNKLKRFSVWHRPIAYLKIAQEVSLSVLRKRMYVKQCTH